MRNLIQETLTAIQEKIGSVREDFEENNGPYPALQRIEKVITKQCQRGT
jgi:serine/threonine-protein kinase HipA